MNKQLIKFGFSLVLILFIGIVYSEQALAATSTKVAGTPSSVKPLDSGGGCSGTKTNNYSGVSVSVRACIGTDANNVNGDGYISLSSSTPSKWSSCSVGVYLYSTSNSGTPADSWWDNCFNSPKNISNQNFGDSSISKSNGNYYSIVEVVGTYNGINIAVVQQSPTQCVGLFC